MDCNTPSLKDQILTAIGALKFQSFPAAYHALSSKPDGIILHTDYQNRTDAKFNPYKLKFLKSYGGFWVCNSGDDKPLFMACPVQPCKQDLSHPLGCPNHNWRLDSPEDYKRIPSSLSLGNFCQTPLFRNGRVNQKEVTFLKNVIKRERKIEENEILESLADMPFRDEELGVQVFRESANSFSMRILVIGLDYEFRTCSGVDCDKEACKKVWSEYFFCSQTCEKSRLIAIPFGKNNLKGSSVKPEYKAKKFFIKWIEDLRRPLPRITEAEAKKLITESLYALGKNGKAFHSDGYLLKVHLTIDGAFQLTWFDTRNVVPCCNNLDCLRRLKNSDSTDKKQNKPTEKIRCDACLHLPIILLDKKTYGTKQAHSMVDMSNTLSKPKKGLESGNSNKPVPTKGSTDRKGKCKKFRVIASAMKTDAVKHANISNTTRKVIHPDCIPVITNNEIPKSNEVIKTELPKGAKKMDDTSNPPNKRHRSS